MGDVYRARRAQPLEAIDDLLALLTLAYHHGRQLPVALQRPHHGSLRLRKVQAIAAVVFADGLAFQLQHVLVGPTQHRLNVRAVPGVDQYGKLISASGALSRQPLAGPPSRETTTPGAPPVPAPLSCQTRSIARWHAGEQNRCSGDRRERTKHS